MKNNSFELPKSFLTQLNEFTKGYFLVTLDENGMFKTYADYNNNQSTELAIINYIDIYASSTQEAMRQDALSQILDEDPDNDETN